MSYKYRTKDYKNEEGEYSEYLPCDKESILELIRRNWTDQRPNGLHVISIINENGESLLLEHFGKDVFDVYFLPTKRNLHFHKKSRQELIYSCLELFMENDISNLERTLNKTTKDNDFIRDEFFFIDHDYKLTPRRERSEMMWLLYAVPYGLIITIVGLIMLVKLPLSLFFLPLMLLSIGTYIWLPGVMLHFQYKKDAESLVIRVTKGSDKIIATTPQATKILNKSDIQSLTKFLGSGYRNPWSEYGYLEIKFSTGEILNLTNLMVDQLFILDKFSGSEIKTKVVRKLIPRLQNETSF